MADFYLTPSRTERGMSTVDELTELEPVGAESRVPDKDIGPLTGLRMMLVRAGVQDRYLIGGALLFAAAISVLAFFLKDAFFDITNLSSWGYVGVFVFTFLGAATIFLPSGGSAAVILAGAVLNPVWVGLLAGAASALGETTGYIIGYEGGAVLEKRTGLFAKAKRWMEQERRGAITIFVLSVFPNPFFDAAGLAAGGIRFPFKKFLFLVWAGKTIQAMAGAFIGAWGSGWLIDLAEGVLD